MFKSINGYTVCCGNNHKITECDNKILEIFQDCITLDVMKKPIYLPCTGQVYDFQGALNWFLTSNKDPLTGVEVKVGNLKFIPLVNYFLCLLCLEQKGNKLYFHQPNMHIVDLLRLTHHVFADDTLIYKAKPSFVQKLKCTDGNNYTVDLISKIKHKNNIIHLDNEHYKFIVKFKKPYEKEESKYDYCMYPVDPNFTIGKPPNIKLDSTYNDEQKYNITLVDIMFRCPFSRRLMDKAIITNYGICVHENFKNFQGCCSTSDTLSDHESMITNAGYMVNLSKMCAYFPNVIIKQLPFVIVDGFLKNPCNVNYMELENIKKIYLTDIPFKSYIYFATFGKNSNKQFDCRDCYFTCKNTSICIYEKYLELKDTIDEKVCNLISQCVNDPNYKLGDVHCCNENKKHLMELRKQYKFPTLNKDNTYGEDLSFLHIRNKVFENISLKMVWFVGCKFESVVFNNCEFSCCPFIGSNLAVGVQFKNCTFRECSLYKTNFNNAVLSIKNKYDTQTIRSLKMEDDEDE